jgi:hypothetical protein
MFVMRFPELERSCKSGIALGAWTAMKSRISVVEVH